MISKLISWKTLALFSRTPVQTKQRPWTSRSPRLQNTNSARRQGLCEEMLILQIFLSDKNHPSQLVRLVSEDEKTGGR